MQAIRGWVIRFNERGPPYPCRVGLVLPCCDTEALQERFAEISNAVDPEAHAVFILDHEATPPRSPTILIPLHELYGFQDCVEKDVGTSGCPFWRNVLCFIV
ncbi:hypothetical protein D3C86_1965330 [compost metagenome]